MATNPNSMVQEAVDAAISKRGEIGLQVVAYVDGKQVVDVWGGLADITTGRQVTLPIALKGGIFNTLVSSRLSTPSSAYFASRASSTPRACRPYFVNTSRFLTFSARSRRVSGFLSKATWQIRSKGSTTTTLAPRRA